MRTRGSESKNSEVAVGQQMPSRKRLITRHTALAVSILSLIGALPIIAQQVQPPEPVDPSPNNGETYYLINRASGLQMDLNGNSVLVGDKILQDTRSFSSLSQRWAFAKMPDGNWKLSNIENNLCLDSTSSSGSAFTVQNPCTLNTPSQEWKFTYENNGFNAITNVSNSEVLDSVGESTSAGAELNQTPLSGSPTITQQWMFRPAFWRGNDSSTQELEEWDRSEAVANTANLPWWHDAYLPGQDVLQIFKNAGLNAIRIRPASINTTYDYDGLTWSMSTGPYTKYTLGAGSATTFPLNATSQVAPVTNPGDGAVETDWSAVDLALRAKKLGMAVFLNLFYDGNTSANTPGNWTTVTLASMEGSPENPNGGNGSYIAYNYVKQLLEFFRAAGAMPDMVACGNEANLGLLGTIEGTNYGEGTPESAGSIALQKACQQAVVDAASEASATSAGNVGKSLGQPVPTPLFCMDIDGTPNLDTFAAGVKIAGIPITNMCQSSYPGWGGPLTAAQHSYIAVGDTNGQSQAEETEIDTEVADAAAGFPIMTAEDGVMYTTASNETPKDDWYGSLLADTPNLASRAQEREYYIDLERVQHNAPNNLAFGMDCWACEATPLSGSGTAIYQYWPNWQLGFFDGSTSTTPGSAAGGAALDNATLPALMGMGGKTDPSLTYMLVNASNGQLLETALASTTANAMLDTAPYTGIVSAHQQWQILAQAGYAEYYGIGANGALVANGTDTKATNLMNNLGDGYFQIINGNQPFDLVVNSTNGNPSGSIPGSGLDSLGSTTPNSTVVQNPETVLVTTPGLGSSKLVTPTGNANQEWDIMTVGNCGDVPANCTTPPLTTQGDYYMIVNKNSGLVLALAGSAIEQQTPAATSNLDWMVPANKGQLWQIFPVHISTPSTPTTLAFAPAPPAAITSGSAIGTLNVDIENNAAALIGSPSESVTLTITGPGGFSKTVSASSSSAVAGFNLGSVVLNTAGNYTVTASSAGLKSATASIEVLPALPTVTLTTSAKLTGTAATGYTATVTVTNSGTGSAANVALTAATLGGHASTSSLPINLGTIAAGSNASVTLNFAGFGTDGGASSDSFAGTYAGGTFSGSARVVLP